MSSRLRAALCGSWLAVAGGLSLVDCGTAQAPAPGVPHAGLSSPVRPAPAGYWFGRGCAGAAGQQVTIAVSPSMRPGFESQMAIDNLPPQELAMLLLGDNANDYVGVPLPLALDWAGMPGCRLLVAPGAELLFGTGSGRAVASFSVPLEPWLAARPIYYQCMFRHPGANAAGLGMSAGYVTRVAPLPTNTSMVSTISQHGVTFSFEQPVEAGQFVNGDWFVVGRSSLVGMTPACTTVNGRVQHGAMINPDPRSHQHGYDSTLFDTGDYQHAHNVAWNLSPSQPLALQPGQSLIKAISNTDTSLLPALKTCAVLTVVASVPPAGSFRPAYAGVEHRVRYDEQMIDWQQLRDVPAAPGMPDANVWQQQLARPWLDHASGWASRFMHPVDNMPNYGRDLATLYNEAALMCHTDLPFAQKRQLAIRLVQIGIDFHGNVENGAFWEGVGGHGSGRKLPILFAGALLDDTEMMSVGHRYVSGRQLDGSFATYFGEDCQTFYVEQTGANEVNWGHGGYDASHIGLAEYGFSHADYPENDDVGWQNNSYRLCCTANGWLGAVLCARMMDLVDAWHHPALFDYTDRYTQLESTGWTQSWSPWVGAMWGQYRPQF